MEAQPSSENKSNGPPTEKEKSPVSPTAFKFNAHAPEFIPRSHSQTPVPSCCYYNPSWFHLGDGGAAGGGAGDWFYFAEQELPQLPLPAHLVPDSPRRMGRYPGSVPDALQRIVKQVEYQFTDANLVASDYMTKLINEDPEGYVSIAAIVSQKKIRSLGSNNFMLANALRASSKLVVSEDGKKVKCKQVFTEREKEEVQSRTVVVENLPEECSRQTLEKIFCIVGRVKNVRICHPQEPRTPRSCKGDILISNKMHALVEYETAEQAEKAAENLNDERNWRKGLRVRVMLRRSPRSVIRNKKGGYNYFDESDDEDQLRVETTPGSPHPLKLPHEQHIEDNPTDGWRRGRCLNRSKSLGASVIHNGRGVLSPAPQPGSLIRSESSSKLNPWRPGTKDAARGILCLSPQPSGRVQSEAPRQTPREPRMPDGTRGFTMGRGKPLRPVSSCPPSEL